MRARWLWLFASPGIASTAITCVIIPSALVTWGTIAVKFK